MKKSDVFYDVGDNEILYNSDRDEAIQEAIEQNPDLETFELLTYGRVEVEINIENTADKLIEILLESVEEQYGSEDVYDGPIPKTREAAWNLVKTFLDEYVPWACEVTGKEEINVKEWRQANEKDNQ